MIERLGYVLGWTGNIFAVLSVLIGVFSFFSANESGVGSFLFVFFVVVGAVIFSVGRAVRYVLTGKAWN